MDYDTECEIAGGNIIIYGSTGMWQNPTSGSTQYCLTFTTTGSSGDKLILKDSSGKEIAIVTTEKSYGAITISNSKIEKGETYTLYKNDSSVGSITANSTVSTTGGSSINNGGSMNGKGMQTTPGKQKGGF